MGVCPANGDRFRGLIEQRRIFKFQSGLNSSLDDARGIILGTKPLPSIREVFSTVRHEESRQKIMLAPSEHTASIDTSALAAQHRFAPPSDDSGGMYYIPTSASTRQFKQGRLSCPNAANHHILWKRVGKFKGDLLIRSQHTSGVQIWLPLILPLQSSHHSRRKNLKFFRSCLDNPVTPTPLLSEAGNVVRSGIASFTSSQHDLSSS